jgi:hypothetical protein
MGEGNITKSLIRIRSNWNVARYLGDSIFSQLQDQANVALHLNGWRTMSKSLEKFIKLLILKTFEKDIS